MGDPLLACLQLSKSYKDGRQTIDVLQEIDFSVRPGQMVGIVGRSGSGKTTLLNCLAGIDTPTTGQVMFAGQSLSQMTTREVEKMRATSMGFVFQFHFLLPGF